MKDESAKKLMSVILIAMMLSTGLAALVGGHGAAAPTVIDMTSTASNMNYPQPESGNGKAAADTPVSARSGTKADLVTDPVYSSLSPEAIAAAGYDLPQPAGVDSYSGIGDVHAMGYNGSDINVAVVDSGIDFGHADLQGTQMVEPETMRSVDEPVLSSAAEGTGYVFLGNDSVVSGTLHVYKNGVELVEGSDYTADYSTGNITFTTPLAQGDSITATYTYNTPYGGWPVAFDPTSMKTFLSTGSPKDTMFADTSRSGPGPFEVSHEIVVDGKNDFYDLEDRGTDPREQAEKRYFDLTDLYATYDSDNWYFGFPLYDLPTNTWSNVTAGIIIDTDKGVTGSTQVPEGKLIDTNASHSSSVTDVAFSPDGTMVASSSMDGTVKIWNPSTGICSLVFDKHTSTPFSLVWSPNGTMITSIDSTDIIIWNPLTGDVYGDIAYPTGPFQESTTEFYTNMRSSFISLSPNGTWLAVGTLGGSSGYYRIMLYNLTTGQEFGHLWVYTGKAYTVAFDATGQDLAVGCDDNNIYVVELNSTNIITPSESETKAAAKYVLSGHTGTPLSLDWSPDNTRIASTGRDGHVIIWNNLSNSSERTSIYPDTTVTNAFCVKWLDNSEVLFSTSTSNQPYQYFRAYAADGSSEYFNVMQDYPVYAFDSHGTEIVTAGGDGNVNIWGTGGSYTRTMRAHRANYAIYVDYWVKWNDRDAKFVKSSGDARIYVWNTVTSSWDLKELDEMGAKFASAELGEQLINEISIPRSRLNTEEFDMELFTAGQNVSHAQDSVPDDFHILDMNHNYVKAVDDYNEPDLDWSDAVTSLSNFARLKITYYTVSGIPSASGTYHFGYHPSPVIAKRMSGLGLLVTDSTTPGVYDKVYLDFNGDHVFDESDVNVTKDNPIAVYDEDSDGFPDFSAGMIYFISSSKEVSNELITVGDGGSETVFSLAHDSLVAFPEPSVKLNGNKWLDQKLSETVTADPGASSIKLSRKFVIDSTLEADVVNMAVVNESSFKTKDGKVWYELKRTDSLGVDYTYSGYSLYAEIDASALPSVPTWLSDTPARTWVRLSSDNYTLYQNGSVRLNNPTIKWPFSYDPFYAYYPLPAGTKIYAFYNFTGPLVANEDYTFDGETGVITLKAPLQASLNDSAPTSVNAVYTYHPYVVDKEKGLIALSIPLNAGDSLEISYDYDGEFLPYSSVYAEEKGLTNLAAGNGNLVAFVGELREGNSGAVTDHGTRIASAIASQTRNPWSNISGVAPGAKLICIMDGAKTSNVKDAWYFAANGYDGYPNTGDEANVVVNAFTYPTKTESGYDYYSRLADYVSMEYTSGKLVFVGSAGSGGYGYGTIPSPGGSPSMITMGGMLDISLYVESRSAQEGPYPATSEVDMMSGKGPTLLGTPKPELVTIEMGYVDVPPQSLTTNDGNESYTKKNQLWISADYSAAVGAGAVAILMQAYLQTHGSLPDVQTTREILMSSADDLGFDSLSQGSGNLNLTKAVYIATADSSAGLTSSQQAWVPGGYHGEHYDAFTNMMLPGTTSSTQITLNNHGGSAVTATVEPSIYKKVNDFDYSEETDTYSYEGPLDGAAHTLMMNSTILVMNGTGLYTLDRNPADQEPDATTGLTGLQNYPMGKLVSGLNWTEWNESWSRADMVRVTAYADFDKYSATGSEGTIFNYSFSLSLQGWDMGPQRFLDQSKVDHSSDFLYPFVQYTNCTFPTENDFTAVVLNSSLSYPYVEETYPIYDTNTISVSTGTTNMPSNVLQVETSNPREKGHDGLVLFLNGDGTEDGIVWNYHIEFFNKTTWSWVSINGGSSDSVSMPAGGSTNVTLSMNVPADTHMGTYEGSIKITTPISSANRTDVVTIPVVVNVGSDRGRVSFGSISDEYLMNPTSFMGGYGLYEDEADRSGDWRYFYVDIPSTGIYSDATGKSLVVDLKWDNMPTDLDVMLFKPSADSFSGGDAGRYGPSSVKEDVASETPLTYEFNTRTGDTEEILATDLTTGLHIIAIRPVRMAGKTPFENITSLDLGIITHSTDLTVQTNNYYDTGNVFFSSTVPFSGLNASAVGPANSETETDIPIPQDYQSWWNFPTWPEWLVRGSYTKVVHVENALIFDVHIWGHSDAPDLDLGIFYDANGDGIAQPSEYVATCADWDADEEVKLTNPVDGDYIIKVLGFDTADPGHFDITISIILATGEGYKITGLDPAVPYTAGDVVTFGMVWNFPGNTEENEYMGAINVGPKNAPDLILIPVSVTLDVTPPAMEETKPGYNEVVNSERPTVLFSFSDANTIDTSSASMVIDGVDYTKNCKVTDTSIIYTPKDDLGEGMHIVNASISDVAGNVLAYSWMFTIDTSTSLGDPNTVIDVPVAGDDGFIYTDSSTYTFGGVVTAGTHFTVNGQPVEVAADGSFTITLNLTEGTNIVNLVASDDMGKTTTRELFIVYDTTAPTFTVTPSARLTRDSGIKLTGSIQLISETGPVTLSVNGRNIPVNTDGTFEYEVLLEEGQNIIDVTATDAAGNSATTELTVTRDTAAPSLNMDSVPEITSTKQLTVSGTAESGAKVYINGKQVITTAGSFSSQVALSVGTNLITVSAVDAAGNVAEYSFTVVYQPDTEISALTTSTAAQTAPALTSTAAMLIALAAIIFLIIGFIVSRFIGGKKGGEDGGAAAVEPIAEVPVEEEVPEEEYEEAETEPEDVSAPEEAEEPEEAEDISDEILEEAIVEEEPEPEVTEPVEEGPFDLGTAVEKGKELLAAGDTVAAMEVFDSVVENAPDEVDGYLGKARVFDATGKWGKALQMVNKALEVDPQSTEAMALKGDIFAGQGKNEMARSAYEQALEIEPGNTDIRNRLSKLD